MYICSSCHNTTLKWTGKCPHCGEWNTLEEGQKENKRSGKSAASGKVQNLHKISPNSKREDSRLTSTSTELDSVLGGGLTRGSLVLLSGEPGIGKSTLALQMSEWYANN